MLFSYLRLIIITLCLLSVNTFAKVESSFRFIEKDKTDYIHVEAKGNQISIFSCLDESRCVQVAEMERSALEDYIMSSKRGDRLQSGLNITAGLSFTAAAFILYFTISSSDSNIPVQLLAVPVFGAVSAVSAVCAVGTKLFRRGARNNRASARALNESLLSCDLDQTEVSSLDEMERGILELEKTLGK